jgi:hypothetical protein
MTKFRKYWYLAKINSSYIDHSLSACFLIPEISENKK